LVFNIYRYLSSTRTHTHTHTRNSVQSHTHIASNATHIILLLFTHGHTFLCKLTHTFLSTSAMSFFTLRIVHLKYKFLISNIAFTVLILISCIIIALFSVCIVTKVTGFDITQRCTHEVCNANVVLALNMLSVIYLPYIILLTPLNTKYMITLFRKKLYTFPLLLYLVIYSAYVNRPDLVVTFVMMYAV